MTTASQQRQIHFSEAPASTIDIATLADTRFIDVAGRRHPYRDPLGRVNINLVEASLRACGEGEGEALAREKLTSWQRHARRALDARPRDERATLDDLFGDEPAAKPEAKAEPPSTVAMRRRLFRKPRPDDEPSVDLHYLGQLAARRQRRPHLDDDDFAAAVAEGPSSLESGEGTSDDEVYEVEEVLDECASRGFLIRWAGWGPDHDSWEPETNVAPQLVADFRQARRLATACRGDDYMSGRTRMLWCTRCKRHLPGDSYSANMRRADASARVCLNHHYKTSPSSGLRMAAHATPQRSPQRSPGGVISAAHALAHSKRAREDAPPAPSKAPRPVARSLSHRQAALEVERCRLFGFSSS